MRTDDTTYSLEEVIITEELDHRPDREADPSRESRALLALTRALAEWPEDFFGQLVKSVVIQTSGKALHLLGADQASA